MRLDVHSSQQDNNRQAQRPGNAARLVLHGEHVCQGYRGSDATTTGFRCSPGRPQRNGVLSTHKFNLDTAVVQFTAEAAGGNMPRD